MGLLDNEPRLADIIGCPEFFVTEIVPEQAGEGCVRLFGCIRRNGLLIPQYSVVMPRRSMLAGANKATLAALAAARAQNDDVPPGRPH